MNRFHNKYHRHNHHTNPTANEPDSAHDPIASPSDPFQGDFHINGTLSAKQGVFDNMSFSGTTAILDQLEIVPKAGTTNYYFKIDSNYSTYPLAEMYLNNTPAFVVTGTKLVGIGTNNPLATLDVRGDATFYNTSGIDGYFSGTLSAAGFSQLGYLQVGFVDNTNTTIKSTAGNKEIYIYAGNNINLKMFANNTNNFPGKLGIKTDTPVETLTVNGSIGLRKSGVVLFDNSYQDTLRIITNRSVDDDQHMFSLTKDGRYIAGDILHTSAYQNTEATFIAKHKFNLFSKTSNGEMLSLTNFTPNTADTGPVIDFYRANGDITNLTSIQKDQLLGSVRVYGYNSTDKYYSAINASVDFYANNNFTNTSQGAYIVFKTVNSTDTTNTPTTRMTIASDGKVTIPNSLTVNTTNYTSDINLKLNVENIKDSLEKIELINGVTFEWDDLKQSKQTGADVGVIAQEIEHILPEAVSIDETGYKTVQYHKIIPLLVECIKDLKREISELKSK